VAKDSGSSWFETAACGGLLTTRWGFDINMM
jgi:hypothetical protein